MELSTKMIDKIKESLQQYGDQYKKELDNGEWKQERKERIALFKKKLSKEKLPNLSETDFVMLFSKLWASNMWGNKESKAYKIVSNNGMEQIRTSLNNMLYGHESMADRYDIFNNSIKGLGSSSITEIMIHVDPVRYSLWNDKPKNILPYLGLDKLLPERVFKYQINGTDYEKCHQVLSLLKTSIENEGFWKLDYLDLDIFLWLLFNEIDFETETEEIEKISSKEIIKPQKKIIELSDPHWDIIAVLADLGNI